MSRVWGVSGFSSLLGGPWDLVITYNWAVVTKSHGPPSKVKGLELWVAKVCGLYEFVPGSEAYGRNSRSFV